MTEEEVQIVADTLGYVWHALPETDGGGNEPDMPSRSAFRRAITALDKHREGKRDAQLRHGGNVSPDDRARALARGLVGDGGPADSAFTRMYGSPFWKR